jgi:MinD superfamily P-loop ATPase
MRLFCSEDVKDESVCIDTKVIVLNMEMFHIPMERRCDEGLDCILICPRSAIENMTT